METPTFSHDVFLSHHSKDKPVVRRIARALRDRGLIIWFDEWSISAGEDIYLAIERGLQESRVQLLFLSPGALDSDWVSMERSAASFRDPSNAAKRLIPVLVHQCALPDTLNRLKYVDLTTVTKRSIQNLIRALPDDIKNRILKEKSATAQQTGALDREEYELLQFDSELNVIAASRGDDPELDEEIIDRLPEKIMIFNHLENTKSSSALGPVHLYFVDIDGFTLMNEKYGHFTGNQIIRVIEGLIRSVFEGHHVSYWSADEFVISTTGLYDNEPTTISQKLSGVVREYQWEKVTPGLFVTVSVGIAKYRWDASTSDEKTVDWLERAIIGNANAKKNGGNQAMIGPETGYRARPKQERLVGKIDEQKDYQWPIPEIRYISESTS